MKHTPGPWSVGDDNITNGFETDDICSDGGEVLAHVYAEPNNGLGHNARLIASAPELLDALEKLTGLVDELISTGQLHDQDAKLLRKAMYTGYKAASKARNK